MQAASQMDSWRERRQETLLLQLTGSGLGSDATPPVVFLIAQMTQVTTDSELTEPVQKLLTRSADGSATRCWRNLSASHFTVVLLWPFALPC
ncbi:uncharacterized [Tachysurus ichikawai]